MHYRKIKGGCIYSSVFLNLKIDELITFLKKKISVIELVPELQAHETA